MLPTSLLTELYDHEITEAEFQTLLSMDYEDRLPYASSLTSRSPSPSTDDDYYASYPPRPASYSSCSMLSSSASSTSTSSINAQECRKVESPESSPPSFWIPLEMDEKVNRRNYRLSLLQNTGGGGARVKYCSFCFHNQEAECVYTSHDLRDSAQNVTCPALFAVVCRHCGATGPDAHTPKFCSMKQQLFTKRITIAKRISRDN